MLVAVLVDLDTADRVASVTGAVVGLAGLVVALIALHAPGTTAPDSRRVRARGGGIAAGGDITAPGAPPRTGAAAGPTTGSGQRDVSATGRGSVAAGGDINGVDPGQGHRP